jgi:hypothetical protein
LTVVPFLKILFFTGVELLIKKKIKLIIWKKKIFLRTKITHTKFKIKILENKVKKKGSKKNKYLLILLKLIKAK